VVVKHTKMLARKLLILDDDPLTGQTIRNIALLFGFSVDLADNHKDFFRLLESSPPDVIALDLVMPDMDGVEVIAELGRRQCSAKVIVTSGVGSRVLDAAGRSASERGLDILGILPKPFTPASLRELLAKCPVPGMEQRRSSALEDSPRQSPGTNISAAELEQALALGEISLSYQPKVACQTGALSGFEALARWRHPRRGLIPPNLFIPLAEKSQLIHSLTAYVVEQGLHWFSQLLRQLRDSEHGQELEKLTLSINISALSLSNVQLFDRMTQLCDSLAIPPQNLIFELTETSAMEDPVSSLELLTRLRLRGFRLSIDDFGTGYSSMLQLVKLPFSEIKVDKSFVMTARDSEESQVVIRTIVGLAHNLGLIVTAEGIENEETAEFLRRIGCTLAQGNYIAQPMPGAAVLPWLLARMKNQAKNLLTTLHAHALQGSAGEQRFELPVRLASRLLKMPMAALTLMNSEELWVKSKSSQTIPPALRANTFYQVAGADGGLVVVNDTFEHPALAGNSMVQAAPHIRFYAGCPVHAADGSSIGALVLLDQVPRVLAPQQIEVLRELTTLLEGELYAQPQLSFDASTRVFTQHGMSYWLPPLLRFCRELALPCTLHVFELPDLRTDALADDNCQHNSYVLSNFSRLLGASFSEPDLMGRFDKDKFIVLQIDAQEPDSHSAASRLEQAVTIHNRKVSQGLDINYRLGRAGAKPGHDYQLLSLLDQADQAMRLQ